METDNSFWPCRIFQWTIFMPNSIRYQIISIVRYQSLFVKASGVDKNWPSKKLLIVITDDEWDLDNLKLAPEVPG